MKLFFFLLLSFQLTCVAQTKFIAHKSHSGDLASINYTTNDNFGLPDISIDSVILENQCIVVVTSYGGMFGHNKQEPNCEDPYLKGEISFETFKKQFSPTTVFVGFPEEKKIKENNLFLFALIFGLSALIQFIRQKITSSR